MTHYYLYIKAGVRLGPDTRFYKVAIGNGPLGRKHLTWLEAYAFEHGHFFVIWSLDAVVFAMKCLRLLQLEERLIVSTTGRELIRTLQDGCEDPAFLEACRSRHKLLMKIDPNYFAYYQLKR